MSQLIKIGETKGHAGPIYSITRGKSSESIFTCSGDRFVAEWSIPQMEVLPFSVKLENPAFKVLHDSEQGLLLLGNSIGGIHVIDLKQGKELRLLQAHEKGVFSFLLLREGETGAQQLLSGGGGGRLNLWSYPEMELLRSIPLHPSKIRCIELLDDGNVFIGQSNGMASVLDPIYFNTKAEWKAHEGGVFCLLHHPNKPLIITGGKDGHLRLWHKNTFEEVLAIPAHNFGIYDLKVINKTYLVSASRDKTLALWDLKSMDVLHRVSRPKVNMHTHSINCLFWDEASQVLISAGDDRRIIFWAIDENA